MNGTEVVTTTGDPAFAVDRDGRILAWNKAAEHCLGYQRTEVVGRRCWRVLQGRDLSSNRYCGENCTVRAMALLSEPIHRTQIVFRTGSGEETPFSMSTLVVRGETGKEIVHLLQCLSSCAEDTASPLPMAPANNHGRLSPRRLEVLKHLGEGKRTEEIAELLGISSATVRHHIQAVLKNLGVHSRLEAVALARRIGLI